jgi:hypothetical protein
MSASTLFGAPLGYDTQVREQWISDLERVWQMFAGRPIATLDQDLAELAKVFTGVSGRTLRAIVADLPEADARLRDLPEAVALQADGRILITPEGRILLDVLAQLKADDLNVIERDRQARALAVAVETRSSWYRDWARKQLSGTLSPPAIGAAVFLLINGSIGHSAALQIPVAESEDKRLGELVLPMVGRFSLALGGKQPATNVGIQSHWAFTQVSRFLARDVTREKTMDGTALYVRKDREQALLADLSKRLAKYRFELRTHALDQLAVDYRDQRGALIAAGVSHEEPVHTRRVIAALVAEDG